MPDTRVDTVYMAKEFANKVGLSYSKEKDYLKEVYARSL